MISIRLQNYLHAMLSISAPENGTGEVEGKYESLGLNDCCVMLIIFIHYVKHKSSAEENVKFFSRHRDKTVWK